MIMPAPSRDVYKNLQIFLRAAGLLPRRHDASTGNEIAGTLQEATIVRRKFRPE